MSLTRSIVRNAALVARANPGHPVFGLNGKCYGFAYQDGAFHAVRESLYATALRVLANSSDPILKGYSRRDRVTSLRAVRQMDVNVGRVLP